MFVVAGKGRGLLPLSKRVTLERVEEAAARPTISLDVSEEEETDRGLVDSDPVTASQPSPAKKVRVVEP